MTVRALDSAELMRFWLLNAVVEGMFPLRALVPFIDSICLNAPTLPGWKSEDVWTCLIELEKEKMVEFIRDEVLEMTSDAVISLRNELLFLGEHGPRKPYNSNQVEFRLTALGGSTWESWAMPVWQKLFMEWSDFSEAEICSADLNLIMARIGWFSEVADQSVAKESIEIQRLDNYPILYWKTLPKVYRATFNTIPLRGEIAGRNYRWLDDWRRESFIWHREPWDLPEWKESISQ